MLYINDSIPTTTKHLHWENVCDICERALKISQFHILILLFPSIFCWYFRYFVSETYLISGVNILHIHLNAVSFYYSWYGAIYKRQFDKTLTLRKCMCMRASLEIFGIFTFLNCYFFRYFVGTSDALSVQMTCLSAYMYRQISQCTDKFPNVPTKVQKDIIGGGGGAIAPLPPPPGYANAVAYPEGGGGLGTTKWWQASKHKSINVGPKCHRIHLD